MRDSDFLGILVKTAWFYCKCL